MPDNKKIAFALGGLGGSNAHGAGFLAAARELNVNPAIISCTSGQIVWAYRFLNETGSLKEKFRTQIENHTIFPPEYGWLNWFPMLINEVPGVCRPAIDRYFWRWLPPWSPFIPENWLDRMLPAQSFVPTKDEQTFREIADCFNREQNIGIVFNVFDPKRAISYLHMNEVAKEFLQKEYNKCNHSKNVWYKPITWESIRDALWLYLYGFENGRQLVDGAYHRQIIVRELHDADTIFSVRPQAERWVGRMPQNNLELRDFEIELWFNASYATQVDTLEEINRLIDEGCLQSCRSNRTFHKIKIVPVEVEEQYKFHDYFVEYPQVFDRAYDKGDTILRETLNLEL